MFFLITGNVEVFLNNQWGSVCHNKWGDEDAHVVCIQLGLKGHIRSTSGGQFGQISGNSKIFMSYILIFEDTPQFKNVF